jgi:hypothetical protein
VAPARANRVAFSPSPVAEETTATAANNKPSHLGTAVLFAAAGQVLNCEATNVSGESRTISVQIFSESGASLSGPVTSTVPDGMSVFAVYNASSAYAYCRVDVDGPASDVRAALAVLTAANGTSGVALAY